MASRLGTVGMATLASVIAFIAFSSENSDSETKGSAPTEHEAATAHEDAPVNFTLPLYTKQSALVCPLAVAFDRREGYGLRGAMAAHLSIFGHDEAIDKSGCQEWREGLPVSLTDEGKKQATEWQAEKSCGMVSFSEGFIFSCSLRNALEAENDQRQLVHAMQQIADAMKDPDKVRLMECIGANPWKVKPVGWTAPTEDECAALQQKLGAAANADEAAAVPATPPDEVALLIAKAENLNSKCRGGSGDDPETAKACDEREAVLAEIEANNWCWGHAEQIGADRIWERCKKP